MDNQKSNIEIAQQYIQSINDRFLRPDEPFDSETKTHNVGCFYIYRGMGRKGVEYSVREVIDEKGAYKVHGKEGLLSDQVCYYLEGFLQGHYDTCEMLGYELVDTDKTADEKPEGDVQIDENEVALANEDTEEEETEEGQAEG